MIAAQAPRLNIAEIRPKRKKELFKSLGYNRIELFVIPKFKLIKATLSLSRY